jgi:hypothetical protein
MGDDVCDGYVRRQDMGVVIGPAGFQAMIGHLVKSFPMQLSLDFLGHSQIKTGSKFTMEQYDHDPQSLAFRSHDGVTVQWSNPMAIDGLERLIVSKDGRPAGRQVTSAALLKQVHQNVAGFIKTAWQHGLGVPMAFFDNCTFNITNNVNVTNNIVVADEEAALALLSGGERIGQKTMLDMVMRSQPDLAARFRFDGRTWYMFEANTGRWSESIVQRAESALQNAIEPLIRDMAPASRAIWESMSTVESLRRMLANRVTDEAFAGKLDCNLNLFALGNGEVLDVSIAPPTRRRANPEDYIRTNRSRIGQVVAARSG